MPHSSEEIKAYILEQVKRPQGFTVADARRQGVYTQRMESAIARMKQTGKIFAAKISHKVSVYLDTQERAEAYLAANKKAAVKAKAKRKSIAGPTQGAAEILATDDTRTYIHAPSGSRMTGIYVPPSFVPARAGASDFMQIRSRGLI